MTTLKTIVNKKQDARIKPEKAVAKFEESLNMMMQLAGDLGANTDLYEGMTAVERKNAK